MIRMFRRSARAAQWAAVPLRGPRKWTSFGTTVLLAASVLTVSAAATIATAPAAAAAQATCTPDPGFTNCASFTYSGGDQSFTVPANITSMNARVFGAGGGGVDSGYFTQEAGGAGGGFASGTLATTPGSTLAIVVGQGGNNGSAAVNATYGGGGAGGTSMRTSVQNGASGGGLSGIFKGSVTQANAAIIAGGGGGASPGADSNSPQSGGGGGASGGGDSANSAYAGQGGTQTAGGAAASTLGIFCSTVLLGAAAPGSALAGGRGASLLTANGVSEGGGGGGGGWYGGGGGRCQDNDGFGTTAFNGPGGGGSGYTGGVTGTIQNKVGTNGLATQPGTSGTSGGSGDTKYVAGVGQGGAIAGTGLSAGGNGLVVLQWSSSYSINKSASAGSVIPGAAVTYTIKVTNTGQNAFSTANPAGFTDNGADLSDDAGLSTFPTSDVPGWTFAVDGPSSVITGSGPLAVGQTATITYVATVQNPDTGNGVLKNTAAPLNASGTCGANCSTSTPVSQVATACPAPVNLQNGSFEAPTGNNNAVAYFGNGTTGLVWKTTAADGQTEIWRGQNSGNNSGLPITAQDGVQWAELNANQVGALYQDQTTTPGQVLRYSLWHRARSKTATGAGSGNDVMQVQIGSTTSQTPQVPDGQTTPNISDGPLTWVNYTGSYVVPAGQTTTRFQFAAISTSSGDPTVGNFLDNITLNSVPCDAITKTVTDTTAGAGGLVRPGDVLQYNLAVTNNGGSPSGSTALKDAIPANTAYVPGSLRVGGAAVTDATGDDAGFFAGGAINAYLGSGTAPAAGTGGGTFAIGANATVSFKVTVNSTATAGTSIANNATMSYTWPPATAVLGSTSNTVSSSVDTPAITLVKSVGSTVDANSNGRIDPGDTITYNFKVTNAGSTTLTGVAVNDSKVTTVTCPSTTLAVGASQTCTGTYVVTASDGNAGTLVNTATATGTPPLGAAAITSATSTVTTPIQVPALTVTKTPALFNASQNQSKVGVQGGHTITITNSGNTPLTAVSASDVQTGAGANINDPDTFTCSVPQPTTLAVGASYTCQSNHTTTQADVDSGSTSDTAGAVGTPPVGSNVTNSATATINLFQGPALTLTKTPSATMVTGSGKTITYTLAVTNSGNLTLTGLAVVDTMTAPATGSPAVTCPVTTLAPGASTNCTASYTTTQADADQGSVANTATATAKTPKNATVTSPVASASVTVTPGPGLTVTKTASRSTVDAAGQTITYTITATNSGNVTLSNVSVADALTTPAGPNPALTCTPATPVTALAPGASINCSATYTTTQADLDNGRVVNTATATGTAPGGAAGAITGTAVATVTATRAPALTLVKSASRTSVTAAGQAINYQFLVTNTGNVTVTGISVADALTAPASPTPTVTCSVTSLAPGASTTCTANYTSTQADIDAGTITDTGTVKGTGAGGTAVTASSTVVVNATASATITLAESANRTTVTAAGQPVLYSFLVTNTGNTTVTGVAIADSFTAPAGPVPSISCPVTTLAPNASTTCTATYTTTQADIDKGTIVNTSTASAKSPTNVTVNSQSSAVTITATQSPLLTVVKTANPTSATTAGQTINYSFAVTNSGNVTITGIAVADVLTAPAAPVPTVTCPATSLVPGATTNCTASYTVTQADVNAGSIKNSATVSGKDPTNATITSTPSTATVTIARSPKLTLVKSASPTTVTSVGQVITYSFAVTNAGNVTETGLAITDTFTAPAGPVPSIGCPTTTLAPGAATTCTGTYTTTAADFDAGSISNSATATAKDPTNATTTSNASTASVTATQSASLSLSRVINLASFNMAGQQLTYTYTLTNTGNVTVNNLKPVITIQAPGGPSPTVVCNTTTLAAGAATTCTMTYTIKQADVDNGSINTSTTATGTDPNGVTVTSNTPTAHIPAVQSPSLSIVKSATPTSVSALGQAVAYSFLVTNTGNVTITGVAVADTFTAPAGPVPTVTCPATTLAPNATTTCTASYAASQADLDAGSITNSATVSGTAPGGATTTSAASSASVSVTRTTALAIVQSGSPTAVSSVGQTVALSFVVTNNSNVTVSGVAVADTLTGPAGPNPTVTCPSTTLAPGASTTCTASYVTTQADLNAGSIRSSGTATATAAGGGAVTSAPSAVTITANQNPKLSLAKSASPSSVPVTGALGTTVNYSYLVTNTGNVTIINLGVTDTVTQGSGTPTAVTCPVTSLAPGVSTTCTNTYVVTATDIGLGGVSNTASAAGRSPANVAVTSNNSSVTVPVASALSLTLAKTASPTTVTAAGQIVTYSFVVTNSGTLTVNNLAIADTFTAPAGPVPTITCPVTTLAPGATTTCTGPYTVTVADMNKGSIANSATASGTALQGGVTVTTTSAASTATVSATQSPKLTVTNVPTPTTITAPGNVGYQFVVTNTGNVSVTGIAVAQSYTAPGGPAPTVTCPVTSLAPGASTTCTATYPATQTDIDAGSIVTSSVATGRDPGNNAVSSAAAPSTVTVTQTRTLSLIKTAATNPVTNPTTVSATGTSVAYTFVVKNTGNVSITGVSVADTFSAPAGPALAITCSVTTLAPGATAFCNGTYTATQADLDAGSINNSATASGKDPAGGTVTSNTSTATVAATQSSTLALTTTSTPATVSSVGQQITYTYAVTNTGNVSVSTLTVTPAFTPPVTPNPTPVCLTGNLAPGASTTCTATYTVTQADLDRGSIVSTATATAKPATGTTTSSNTTTTTTGVTVNAALTVAKSASPVAITAAPSTITYSFVVKNTGNVTVKNIAVADTFTAPAGPDGGVTCPVTTLAPGASTTCTSTYVASQADFNSGSIVDSATASGLTPAGAAVTSPASSATVTAVPTPSLNITQTVAPTPVTTAGTALTYSFKVTNNGNVTVSGISVADTFTAPAGPALTITCPVTTLAPGTSTTCTAPYTTTQADVDKGSIANVATASGKAPSGNTVTSPSSTGTLPIASAPAATVTNVASPTTVTAAGQTVNYSFTVKNTGNVTLTNPTLADSFTAPGGPVPTVTCPTTTLAPGVSTTCTATYTVSQADVDKGSIVNSVIATLSTPTGGSLSTSAASSTVTVAQTAGLTVAKSATPTTVTTLGQTVTYSFLATNTGNTTLTALVINDTFTAPAGPVPTVTCPATTLVPGQSTTCTASYRVTQADLTNGVITNSATATATRPGGTTLTSTASTATVAVTQTPQLNLAESANPTTVTAAGQQINFSFPVSNTGNVPLTNLVVTAAASAPAGPAPVVTCPATTVAAGASLTCTATYTTTQADVDKGSVVISSTATALDPGNRTVTSPTASATVTVTQGGALTLVQTRSTPTITAAGQTVNYSFLVTNTGNTTITSVAISDTLTAPAGPPLSITCPVGTLAPNASTTCTATYTSTQLDIDKGSIVNAATATAKDPNNASLSSASTSTSVTATRTPALTVAKTANPTTVTAAGQTVGYSFLVTNTGNVTLTSPTINDTFTAPAGPVPTITCQAVNLRPNTTTTCAGTYTTTQADMDKGSIVNSATASALDPSNTTVTSAASVATVAATSAPKLTVTNTATPTTVNKTGDRVSYSFVVTNTGNVTVTGIVTTDSFTAPGGPVPTVTCPATTLAPNSSTTCTATYSASQADIDAGSIVNSVVASGKDPSGTTTTSNTATSTVTVGSAPGLTVVNTGAPATVTAAGQTVSYTFAVRNTGNVTVSGIGIADAFTAPGGPVPAITCAATSLVPGGTTNCTATYTTTQADIDNGSIVNTATATGVTPNNQPVTSPASQSTVAVTQSPSMTLMKTGAGAATGVGSTINYSFVVTNTGNVTLSLIAVADQLAAPAAPEIAVTCPQRTLLPGGTTTCTGTYTVTQADVNSGSVNDSATVSAQDPQGRPIASAGSGASTSITRTPALQVAVNTTPASVNAVGQQVTLNYTITNNGNVTDTNVAAATTFAAPSGTGSPVSCQSTSLAPGASTTCTSTYVVTQADLDKGSIVATSAGSAQGPGGAAIAAPPVATTIPVTVTATLTVTKTANPLRVNNAGDQITYTFAVRNTGNVTLSGVAITDTFATPAGPGTPVTCDATTLAPGATTNCSSTYVTTAADVVQGSISNTAVANAQTPTGTPVQSAGSSAVVSINQDAALQLTKTAGQTSVSSPGQVINYSFVVTNTGNLPLAGIVVTDNQDVGAPAAPNCPVTTLAPSASTTCTLAYTVTQADLDRGSVNDNASAAGTDTNNTKATSNTSNVSVSVVAAPALGLTVTTKTNNPADPTTYNAVGQQITYTSTLTNNGNQTLTNPTITAQSEGAPGATPPANCGAGPILPGASVTCTAVYTVTQADINFGSVRGSAIGGATGPTGGPVNSATVRTNVQAVQTENVVITQTVSPNPVSKAGDVITYTYDVTETGNVSSTGGTIIDTMTAPAGPPPSVVCTSPDLTPGVTVTCTGTYTVTQADIDNGTITNSAVLSGVPPDGVRRYGPPQVSVVNVTPNPALTLVETGSPASVSSVGQSVTYTFVVTNNGNKTVTGLAVNQAFTAPAGSGSAVTCPVTTLAPGASTTCTSSYTVTQADLDNGSIVDTASATGTGPNGAVVLSPQTTTTTAVAAAPRLTEVVTASPGQLTGPGQTVTYSVAVTNAGNVSVSGVAVAQTFSGTGTAPAITCPTGAVAPGATVTCTGSYVSTQADVDAGSITDAITASGTPAAGGTVTSAPSTATVTFNTNAKITLSTTVSTATVKNAGDQITYTFTATNTGNTSLSGFALTSTFTAPAGPALVITCPSTTIAPGATVVCTATYTTTQADVDHGSIRESTTAGAADPQGNAVSSAPSDTTIGATRAGALTVVKSADTGTVSAVGTVVTYSFVVTNTGNLTLSSLGINDSLTPPAGPSFQVNCPVTTLAPTATTTCQGTYRVTQADLDNGSIRNSATAGAVDTRGNQFTSAASTANVAATRTPALTLSEVASPTVLTGPGQPVNYTFTATNSGNQTLTGLTVADHSSSASPDVTVTCASTTLAPGTSTTCTASYISTQPDVDRGSIIDTAVASAASPVGTAVTSNGTGATVLITQYPSLSVVNVASPSSVNKAGDKVSLTVVVLNTGNTSVTGIVTTEAMTAPAGPNPTVTCPATTLLPGADFKCTATYTVTQADIDAGIITATAGATGTSAGAPVTAEPDPASVTVNQTGLLAVKTAVSTTGVTKAGDPVTYTFTATNNGNTTLTGLALADTFTAPAGPAMTINCPNTTVAPGASVVCTGMYVTTQADFDQGSIAESSTATATGPDGTVTSAPSNAITALPRSGALTLVESTDVAGVTAVGDPVVFSYKVTNSGNLSLGTLAIASKLAAPAGPAMTVTCPVTTLAPGETTTCQGTYQATQADLDKGSITDAATATAVDTKNGTVRSNATSAGVTVVATPSLSLTEVSAPATITAAGQVVTYTFTATNTGELTLKTLAVADRAGAAHTAVTVTCTATTLAPGASTTCTARYVATQADVDAGTIMDTATATASTSSGRAVTSEATGTTVTVTQTPGLTVRQTAAPTPVSKVGQTLTFSVVVSNTGNTTETAVSASEQLTAPAGPNPKVICPATTLAPGQAITCTATYEVTQADVDSGSIIGVATATGTSVGTRIDSGDSPVQVPVTQIGALSTKVTSTPVAVTAVGQKVTVSFAVTNTGNLAVDALTLGASVAAPGGPAPVVTCAATSVAPGATVICTAVYTATQADLDAGHITVTGVASGVTAPGGKPVTAPAATLVIPAGASALHLSKSAGPATDTNHDGKIDAGDTVVFTYTLQNTGSQPLTDLTVTDPLVGTLHCSVTGGVGTIVAARSAAFRSPAAVAALAPGATVTCSAPAVKITQAQMNAGLVGSTATATAVDANNKAVRSNASATSTPLTRSAKLTLVKTGTVTDVNHDKVTDLGDTIAWTFLVTNTGTVTVVGVGVSDPTAGAVTCRVTTLAPGASTTCAAVKQHVVTATDVTAGGVTNTATPTGTCLSTAGCPAVVEVKASVRVLVKPTPVKPPVVPTLGVVLGSVVTDTNGDGVVDPGDVIGYTLTVTNPGPGTVTGIGVLENGIGAIACSATTIPAGGSVTCAVPDHLVTAADGLAGAVDASVTVTGTGPGGVAVGPMTAHSVTVIAAAPTPAPTPGPTPNPTPGPGPVTPHPPLSYTGAGPVEPLLLTAFLAIMLGLGLMVIGRNRRRRDSRG